MAKYKLKALSMNLGGRVYRKKDKQVFDSESKDLKPYAKELKVLHEKGFLVLQGGAKKQTSKKED